VVRGFGATPIRAFIDALLGRCGELSTVIVAGKGPTLHRGGRSIGPSFRRVPSGLLDTDDPSDQGHAHP
jgi:hypothetical protein